MEFKFNLPPAWTYRYSKTEDEYYFWRLDNPEAGFTLGGVALGVYADQPEQLVEIIQAQLSAYEMGVLTNQVLNHRKSDAFLGNNRVFDENMKQYIDKAQ